MRVSHARKTIMGYMGYRAGQAIGPLLLLDGKKVLLSSFVGDWFSMCFPVQRCGFKLAQGRRTSGAGVED